MSARIVRDRQVFGHLTLPNGIEVHHYPCDSPLGRINLSIGYGAAHNEIKGMAYLLQLCSTSDRTAIDEFRMRSGSMGAVVYTLETLFTLEGVSQDVASYWKEIARQIFFPSFDDDTVNRKLTSMQRQRRSNPFYPGESPREHFLSSAWMDDRATLLEDIFGTSHDLGGLDANQVASIHAEIYHRAPIRVVSGGSMDLEEVTKPLAQLPQVERIGFEKPNYRPLRWASRRNLRKAFDDVSVPSLKIGIALDPLPSLRDLRGIFFLGHYLTNDISGGLYTWLCVDKEWGEEVDFTRLRDDQRLTATFTLPAPNLKEAETTSRHFLERCIEETDNHRKLADEAIRQAGSDVYQYETLEQIVNGGWDNLGSFGRIVPEAEWRDLTMSCAEPGFLTGIAERYLSPKTRGELVLLPSSRYPNYA